MAGDTVPRDDVRAVLEAIREDARNALTAPVHHAYAESALKLEQLLGLTPASPGFNTIGGDQ
jgi:hypothetical protein